MVLVYNHTNTIMEKMIDIKGYEGLYAVTKSGKVWGYPKYNWSGRFMRFFIMNNGYLVASLYKNHIQKKILVHRLVALTYIPNPKNLPEVNHKNSNRLDNNVKNLEWVTSKQNKEHAKALGHYKNVGKHIHHSPTRLNENQVKKIRKLFAGGNFTQREIAQKFNISRYGVSSIVRRVNWKHI